MTDNKKEKDLHERGVNYAVEALKNAGYSNIEKLAKNEEFASISCEKDNKKFVICVRARNRYNSNGKLNSSYVISHGDVSKKAENAKVKHNASEAYWIAVQIDRDANKYSVYMGSLKSLGDKKSIPIPKCESGEIGEILVDQKEIPMDSD